MNNGAKNIVTRVIDLVMKCLLVVIMVFPFYWMVITAFKTQKESMIFFYKAILRWNVKAGGKDGREL